MLEEIDQTETNANPKLRSLEEFALLAKDSDDEEETKNSTNQVTEEDQVESEEEEAEGNEEAEKEAGEEEEEDDQSETGAESDPSKPEQSKIEVNFWLNFKKTIKKPKESEEDTPIGRDYRYDKKDFRQHNTIVLK